MVVEGRVFSPPWALRTVDYGDVGMRKGGNGG